MGRGKNPRERLSENLDGQIVGAVEARLNPAPRKSRILSLESWEVGRAIPCERQPTLISDFQGAETENLQKLEASLLTRCAAQPDGGSPDDGSDGP